MRKTAAQIFDVLHHGHGRPWPVAAWYTLWAMVGYAAARRSPNV